MSEGVDRLDADLTVPIVPHQGEVREGGPGLREAEPNLESLLVVDSETTDVGCRIQVGKEPAPHPLVHDAFRFLSVVHDDIISPDTKMLAAEELDCAPSGQHAGRPKDLREA